MEVDLLGVSSLVIHYKELLAASPLTSASQHLSVKGAVCLIELQNMRLVHARYTFPSHCFTENKPRAPGPLREGGKN